MLGIIKLLMQPPSKMIAPSAINLKPLLVLLSEISFLLLSVVMLESKIFTSKFSIFLIILYNKHIHKNELTNICHEKLQENLDLLYF